MTPRTAYDDMPYKSMPIEWTAPERLALASLLHGGPRPRLDGYRVLELGCADGANLLPMAFFRPEGHFVGIDSASSQISAANARKSASGAGNLDFVCADFRDAHRFVRDEFDFIIAHGVFSWIPDAARDAMLELCARHLRHDGLLYLNYNTYPGWNVRGMVRKFLLARTDAAASLGERALFAQEIATRLAGSIESGEHPFTRLLAKEFRFVAEHHHSYVAHEYLADDNHAYWRGDFLRLVGGHGFEYVADADFSYPSGRVPASPLQPFVQDSLTDLDVADTEDLLSYRQLHSPILCVAPMIRRPPTTDEFANLIIASNLSPCAGDGRVNNLFQHPSGYTVEAKEEVVRVALLRLRSRWPEGLRIGDVFEDVGHVLEDLKLLQRNGLLEIRCPERREFSATPHLLNRMEAAQGDYVTTPYHTREAVLAEPI